MGAVHEPLYHVFRIKNSITLFYYILFVCFGGDTAEFATNIRILLPLLLEQGLKCDNNFAICVLFSRNYVLFGEHSSDGGNLCGVGLG